MRKTPMLAVGVLSATISVHAVSPVWHGEGLSTSAFSANAVDGGVTLSVKSSDMWGTSDSGGFYYAPQYGDCEIVAKVPCIPIGDNATEWAKHGLMMRADTTSQSRHVFAYRNAHNAGGIDNINLCSRSSQGGSTVNRTAAMALSPDEPVTMRMRRIGSTVEVYVKLPSEEGWTLFNSLDISDYGFADGVLLGVVYTPNGTSSSGTATYTDLVARELVEASVSQNAITLSWVADQPFKRIEEAIIDSEEEVASGDESEEEATSEIISLASWLIERRTVTNSESWTALETLPTDTTSYTDSTATDGVSYQYRVTANLSNGNTFAVGTSRPSRIVVSEANALNDQQNGTTDVYVQNGVVTGCNVHWTSVYNPWNNLIEKNGDGSRTIPEDATSGLSSWANFEMLGRAALRVDSTGLWEFRAASPDDGVVIRVNGQTILNTVSIPGRNVYSSPVWLEKNRNYPLEYDYRNNSGLYSLVLYARKVGSTSWNNNFPRKAIPYPWTLRNMGDAPLFGSMSYDYTARAWNVAACGLGFDGTFDEGELLTMADTTAQADMDFVARVVPDVMDESSRIGIAIRSDVYTDTNESICATISADTAYLTVRTESGAVPTVVALPLDSSMRATCYIRLARRNGSIYALVAPEENGSFGRWSRINTEGISVPQALTSNSAQLALIGASGNRSQYAKARIDKVSVLDHSTLVTSLSHVKVGSNNALAVNQSSSAAERIAKSAELSGWYWADDLSRLIETSDILTWVGMPTDSPSLLAENVACNSAMNFDFSTSSDFEGQLFRVVGKSSVFDDDLPCAEMATCAVLTREPVLGLDGQGLAVAEYGSWQAGPSGTPDAVVESAFHNWNLLDKVQNFPHTAGKDDGNRKNYIWAVYTGWFTPPYSGYYRFRSVADTYFLLSLNGEHIFNNDSAPADHALPNDNTSEWMFLEGGCKYPISGIYRQDNNGNYGVMRLLWQNGWTDVNADEWSEIPAKYLSASSDLKAFHYDEADAFGEWHDLQWGSNLQGQTIANITTPAKVIDPQNLTLALISCSSGGNIEGASDVGHYFYRKVEQDSTVVGFEIEADLTFVTGWSEWARAGISVRESIAANSRAYETMRMHSKNVNGIRVMSRKTTGTNITYKNVASGAREPCHIRYSKYGSKLRVYVNDVEIECYNVSDWTDFYVGFAGSSNAGEHHSIATFENVVFRGVLNKPTMILVR